MNIVSPRRKSASHTTEYRTEITAAISSEMQCEILLRLPSVLGYVPFKRSTLWKLIRDGKFPRPVKIGQRAVAWKLSEVRHFVNCCELTAR